MDPQPDLGKSFQYLESLKSLAKEAGTLDEDQRSEALKYARIIHQTLEKPWDAIGRMFWQEPTRNIAINTAIDLGFFESLSRSNVPSTIFELAQESQADVDLSKRILRHLAAANVLQETATDTYASTPLSNILATPEGGGSMAFLNEVCQPCYDRMPEYLRSMEHKDISASNQTAWQYCMETDLEYYQWLKAHPVQLKRFLGLLHGFASSRPRWLDLFPTDRIIRGYEEGIGSTLIVDVGGGTGRDLEPFLEYFPDHPGRLVLQDLPEVVSAAKISESITKQAYDFFTPQPIIGARVYFMHSILHNWDDEHSKQILEIVGDAMLPGYSILLVVDVVIKDQNARPQGTALDLTMLSLFGSKERTESDWRDLYSSVGLKMSKVWESSRTEQFVMEVEKR